VLEQAEVSYAILKVVHLLAVVLWIGPALGAYWFLYRAHREADLARRAWVERLTERVLVLEHVALVVVIVSGVALVEIGPWGYATTPWLQKKLVAFAGVLLFEAFDIYLAHVLFRRLLATERPFEAPAWLRAERLRLHLIRAAVIVGGLLIPAMFFFAVWKQ